MSMRAVSWAIALAAMVAPGSVFAANANKPRIPVVWAPAPCVQVVDRSTTSTLQLDYLVPEEDLGPRTPDEVADSRTHQFFAFARQDFASVGSADKLTRWITQADIDRSAAVDPMVVPEEIGPEDVLETTSRFVAADWVRITNDDARVPISDAQAAMGVQWDLGNVPAGSYVIWGYTFDPLLNLWSQRPGLVKIIDGPSQADAAGPSIALLSETLQIVAGEPHRIAGCADVAAGSTVTLEWGSVVGAVEPTWEAVVEEEPIASGMLPLDFVPPSAASGATVKLRATVTDPDGNQYVAYSPGALAVLPGEEQDEPAESGCALTERRRLSPVVFGVVLLLVASSRRRRPRVAASALMVAAACGSGSAGDGDAATTIDPSTTSDGDTSTSDSGDEVAPASGPLACPEGEACTLVIVSQAFDDRLDIFAARGPGPVYRGAIDVDFKPNPMGDNSGENLDEPYGLALDERGLTVLVGHYPMRDSGSLLLLPHELLAMQAPGATLLASQYFDAGTFSAGVTEIALLEEEPIFVRTHPSGRLLIGVFDNDLFALETEWTNPGKLLVVDPTSGEVGARTFDAIGSGSCAGAWSVVALDDDMDAIALACDGDEGAVVLDVSAVGEGTVADAAAAIDGCVADVPFPDKRVRYLAPDGAGGFLLAENSQLADFQDGRLWRFDGACQQLGATGVIPGPFWEVREIVHLPHADGARWLLPTGRTADRGVHVVRDGDAGPEICAKLDDFEPYWADDAGGELHPYALALDRDARGLAIGAGPAEALSDGPGYGRVLWAELDPATDPCASSPVTTVIDLTASAPAVAAADPSTWRRAPNVVLVKQYE
jgi:hypothetical protein